MAGLGGEDREDVVKFLALNGVDDRASTALLGCEDAIQDAVMARGNLTDARNPSAAILGRIRDAKKLLGEGGDDSGMPAESVEAQIEDFISNNGLDDKAAEQLRATTAEIGTAVLARGSLQDARNPSSAVLGRIKDAQRDAAKGKGRGLNQTQIIPGATVDENDVHAFIAEQGVDERASEALLKANPDVQAAVLGRGTLQNARNPSSALLGRVREFQKQSGIVEFQGGKGGFGGMQGGPLNPVYDRVTAALQAKTLQKKLEEFIVESGLDERAEASLRESTASVQQHVIERGPVTDARNPSSACLGRIKDAKKDEQMQMGMMNFMNFNMNSMGGGCGGCGGMDQMGMMGMGGGCGGFGAAAFGGGKGGGCAPYQVVAGNGNDPFAAYAPGGAAFGAGKGGGGGGGMGMMGCGGGGMGMMREKKKHSMGGGWQDIHVFLGESGVDERAANMLMELPTDVQQAVMDLGPVKDCRNPSSALLGRIKDCQGGAGGGGRRGGGGMGMAQSGRLAPPEETEKFIMDGLLDERAADAMRASPPQVQAAVIDRGTLQDCRNPSSAVCGRIKDATHDFQRAQGGGGMNTNAMYANMTPQQFIMENNLDDRASSQLLSASPEVQQQVIQRGGTTDCRNPSSAILGRIRDASAKQNDQMGGGGAAGIMNMMMMQGGMDLSGIFPGMGGQQQQGGEGGGRRRHGWDSMTTGDSVQDFIIQNKIDDRAAEDLMSSPPEVQQAVLARGGLNDARNPSSAILGRIRDAKQQLGFGGGGGGKGGGMPRRGPY